MTSEQPEPARGVTARALLLGAFAAVVVNVWVPFSDYSAHSSRLIFSHLPMATLLPVIVVLLPVNTLVKALAPARALRPPELMVIVAMAWVASVWPSLGLTGYILTIIATPYYFASAENQWAEVLQPYLPTWLAPTEKTYAMEWFFNGKPAGEAIPWGVWAIPLVWWLAFVVALFLVAIGLAVIFRRQWVEHERLVYPLGEVPAQLVTEDPAGGPLPCCVRNRLFWWGFALPAGVICWNMVSYWYPFFPTIPLVTQAYPTISFGRDFPPIFVRPNLFVMSFAYLTTLEVLASVWVFHLLSVLASGLMNRMGFTIGAPDIWCETDSVTSWTAFGGMIFFVSWGLWVGRRHLGGVLARALGRPSEVDDSGEMMSYRQAVLAVLLGTLFLGGWLHASGMGVLATATFLFGCFIVYVGVAKIVAQCGLVYLRASLTAQSFATHTLGTAAFGPSGLGGLLVTYGFVCDAKPTALVSVVHVARLGDWLRGSRRALFWAVLLAVVAGGLTSFLFTLQLAYSHGAYNFDAWEFQSGNVQIVSGIVSQMKELTQPSRSRLTCLVVGAAICGGLIYLRYRFPWWPLHPIGFTVSSTSWALRVSVFSIFLAWLVKLIVLRVGGNRLYTRSRPFFLGMLVGYVTGVAISFVADIIWFPGEGHMVHHW